MSTFTINTYLLSGGYTPRYILSNPNDPSSRIIASSFSYVVDDSYRAIGAAVGRRSRPVQSFNIKSRPNGEWYLMTNQQTFAGKYSSQSACLGVLFGIMTYNNGLDANGFEEWLVDCLNKGSTIDGAENVLALTHTSADITVTLADYDTSTTSGYAFVYFGYEMVVDGVPQGITISDVQQLTIASTDADQNHTFTGGWASIVEGNGARPVLVGFDGAATFTVVSFGPAKYKPVPDPVIDFEVEVSGANGLPATDVELGGFAYAVITDSSTDGTPSFTYEWYQSVPTLTGITLTNEGT